MTGAPSSSPDRVARVAEVSRCGAARWRVCAGCQQETNRHEPRRAAHPLVGHTLPGASSTHTSPLRSGRPLVRQRCCGSSPTCAPIWTLASMACITSPVRPPPLRPCDGRQRPQPYTQMSNVFCSGGCGMLLVSLERMPTTGVLLLGGGWDSLSMASSRSGDNPADVMVALGYSGRS